MLPSTGYFKTIACPFYEEGSCDRPYCHFKHARREETTNVLTATLTESHTKNVAISSTLATTTEATDTLSQLVSEAVKKVLAEQQVIHKEEISKNIVSKVVEELKPTLAGSLQTSTIPVETPVAPVLPITNSSSCTYNPTPISELKKRHISIPIYNPIRESKVTVKRKGSPSDERKKSWHSILFKNDDSDDATYKPAPVSVANDSVPGYVPTAKSASASTPVSYDPSVTETYVPKAREAYYPKPKKRREEYVPKKIKTPLNTSSAGYSEYDVDEVYSMSSMNQDSSSNSQEYMDIEPKFSEDEEEDFEVKTDKDVKIEDIKVEDKSIEEQIKNNDEKSSQEKENREAKSYSNKSRSKDSSKKSSSRSKHSSSEKSSSKTDEQFNGRSHSRSKSKDRENEKESKKKDDKKHTSKHDSKTKHSSKGSSSSSCSKHSSSSKESSKKRESKDKDKKDKDKKESTKDDSHKSKKSSKPDKESSEKHKKKSSSSSSRDDKSKERKKNSESSRHSDRSKDSKSSKKEKESSKSSSKKEPAIDEKLFLSEKDFFDDSDVDIEEECYKIFQEYEESDQPKVSTVSQPTKRNCEDTEEEVGKKRIAHAGSESSSIRKPGPSQPIKKQPNPQQRLYERWRLMKEAAAQKEKSLKAETQHVAASPEKKIENSRLQTPFPSQTKESHNFNGNGKVRIAHVPYAMSLALAKKPIIEKAKEPEVKTVAQTNKGKVRVAHIPQSVPQLIRPEPLEINKTQKFSLNVRQCYVNAMHDVCIQIYTNGEDAVQRALKEEWACYERCKSLNVYKNSCLLAIHRLKKEVEAEKVEMSVPSVSGMVSHEAVLAGKSKGSWSIMKPKKVETNFKGSALYNKLTKWIMYDQQLKDNGYPRPHPDGQMGHAKTYTTDNRNKLMLSKVPNERTCSRCGQTYTVDRWGFQIRQQNCIYHHGRKYTVRGEGRYNCCNQYGSAPGCADAKTHVWDYVDYENLRGYVTTLPKDLPDDEQGIYSLDCEMCYTTQGLELTRVTVINEDCQVVYETLVKPENPIIDYNTRFSGITEEAMRNVETTIHQVQATLLTIFSSKTILIGHSLESDFKALKLIHDTVVDTSIMFPHKNGHPHKRALKNLCTDFLRKIIQNDVSGHDSNEDAIACMELVLWKIKEEAKLQ